MCKELKQKEVRKFIAEENIQVCVVLETHLKTKSIGRACDFVFGKWRRISNVSYSPTSCRIVVGWNIDEVDIMIVQPILCLVEIIQSKKSLVDQQAWVLMGNSNVTLKLEEHSNGTSRISVDMEEFRDTINSLEVEDISSTGFQFTWTKSYKNLFVVKIEEGLKAKELKEKLKVAQSEVDVDPYNKDKKKNAVIFFIKAMKHKSRVESICCEDRRRVEGNQVPMQFVSHFNNFLGDAFFDIDSSKAVGPDGYTSCFFEKSWHIIGNDICLAANSTVQISFINVISKILTNRIKDGLSKVVSLNQSAFIPGRHIQDNILITQELLKGYNRKTGAKRYAMKIDIQKAYDTINWDFLKEVMLLVGLHEVTVHWMMTCITTPSFSICVNGEINGYFKGERGLRQGDPISPYLFTLVMEVFNMIMIKNIKESNMHGA
ncbi:RNA-directed DNA polymerase, eukaryota, reverse transcriptase zinc-binding domain protein [Tanacetum coccineum]